MLIVDFLILVGVIFALIFGTTALFGYLSRQKAPELITRPDLRALRERASIGEKLARSIANGAGNPTLEAQIALEEIENIYDSKELN